MKRTYQITGALLILLALFILREANELSFYTPLGPGPGFFPFWLSVILVSLGGVIVVQASFKESDPMPADFFPSRKGFFRAVSILLALAFVVKCLDMLGFRLTMLVFYLFLLTALGRQNLLLTVVVALAGSWGIYYVFVEWLKVILPVGMFGF